MPQPMFGKAKMKLSLSANIVQKMSLAHLKSPFVVPSSITLALYQSTSCLIHSGAAICRGALDYL